MDDLLKLGIPKKDAEVLQKAKENFYSENSHIDGKALSSVSSIPELKPFTILAVSAYKEGDKIGDSVANADGSISISETFSLVPCIYKTTLGNIGAKHFARISNWDKFKDYDKRPNTFGSFDENLTFGLWAQHKKIQFIVTEIKETPIRNAKPGENGKIPTQKQYNIEVFEEGKDYAKK